MSAADPAVDRFRADLVATLGRPIEPRDTIAIAVSGGPDSMALLALAATAWPRQVIAATVDHGLRSSGADEAAMVASYCASPGEGRESVSHATLEPAMPLGSFNLQANARTARYALLTGWARSRNATILATAHHADDQAETFLMRAARGSGIAGLAAIRPARHLDCGLILLRPLLTWRRSSLRALAEKWHLPFADDPSNASDRHDRTRFRTLLEDTPWLDGAQLARAAGHLLQAEGDLRAIEGWLSTDRSVASEPGGHAIDVAGLPRELRRRLARAGIAKVRDTASIVAPAFSPASNVESLLDALAVGKSATQGGVMVSPRGKIWHFRPEPPRRGT